ncbi:MAG: hypothetical protein KF812_05160 [Fimbriimonadaceae bacterium]|nr:hypothetical protein [Fimbriimonadaceae bacterium]
MKVTGLTCAALAVLGGSTYVATRTPESPAQAGPPVAPRSLTPTGENFVQWRNFILPDSRETSWQTISWRSSAEEGFRTAQELGRPVLLWTMNGHPLGCT